MHHEHPGESSLLPSNISRLRVLTDCLVTLAWVNSYSQKFDKMQYKFLFVQNKLNKINVLCDRFLNEFSLIACIENPADCLIKSISHKLLMKTNLFTCPSFLQDRVKIR